MYEPVKTTCQVYLTTDHSDMFRIHHNCASCPNVGCSLRNVSDYTITRHDGGDIRVLEGRKGYSLMELLQEQGIFLPAVCAGTVSYTHLDVYKRQTGGTASYL